jgi:hypothetical protein
MFAKVARHDYPREWPSMLADLLGQLQVQQAVGSGARQPPPAGAETLHSTDSTVEYNCHPAAWLQLTDLDLCMFRLQGGSTLTVRRVYFTLHHVLKELSSKRLAADQRAFAEVSRSSWPAYASAHDVITASCGLTRSCSPAREPNTHLPPLWPAACIIAQLTVQLFDHVWGQWQADLQTVVAGLPVALTGQMPAQQLQQLLLHFERWLVLLKVRRGPGGRGVAFCHWEASHKRKHTHVRLSSLHSATPG